MAIKGGKFLKAGMLAVDLETGDFFENDVELQASFDDTEPWELDLYKKIGTIKVLPNNELKAEIKLIGEKEGKK